MGHRYRIWVFLVFCSWAAQSHAATLERLGGEYLLERWENGQLVETRTAPIPKPNASSQSPQSSKTRAAWVVGVSDSIEFVFPCRGNNGCEETIVAKEANTFTISAEPGEANGDAVSYCATWTGAVSAGAESGSAAAAAAGGGMSPKTMVSTKPAKATASVSEAAFVQVQDGTKYIFDQLAARVAPPNTSDSSSDSIQVTKRIAAEIGDKLTIELSIAMATSTPFGETASSSASSKLSLTRCPQASPVPLLSWPGLTALLASMMGLGGLILHRRHQSA